MQTVLNVTSSIGDTVTYGDDATKEFLHKYEPLFIWYHNKNEFLYDIYMVF